MMGDRCQDCKHTIIEHEEMGWTCDCVCPSLVVPLGGGMMKKIILKKEYHGFESAVDIERDISEMWEDSGLPGEFQGKVIVTVEYVEEE